MNVNTIYELCQFIINKEQSGYLAPDDFNRIMNQAQLSYMSWLLGTFQNYIPGRPVARVELGQNAVVRDRLAPSIYNFNLSVDATGFSPYPGDFLQADAMWSIYGYDRVRWSDQARWYAFYNSRIDPVANFPIYRLDDTGFVFAPENLGAAKLSYVRNPPNISWAYTLDGNGLPVYDSVNSVDPIWDDLSIWDIVSRALDMVGVNLQAPQVAQYAAQIKNVSQ